MNSRIFIQMKIEEKKHESDDLLRKKIESLFEWQDRDKTQE